MSSPEAKKPTYLQDVIAPKEAEHALEGFDLDREFGKGVARRIEKELEDKIEGLPAEGPHDSAYREAVWYRILFGKNCWTKKDADQMEKALRTELQNKLGRKKEYNLVSSFAERIAERISGMVFIDKATIYHLAAVYRTLFGKGFWTKEEHERMEEAFKDNMKKHFGELLGTDQIGLSVSGRILFGRDSLTKEQQEYVTQSLKERLQEDFAVGSYTTAAENAAAYRLMKAHDLRFTDEGIEIIDTPPQFQQAPIPPMPEERKF